jgi:hypothetical protein
MVPRQPVWDLADVGRFLLRCSSLLAASAAGLGVPVDPRLISRREAPAIDPRIKDGR